MGKKRMNLECSEEFEESLETLKEQMRKPSKAEVIRSAVALLKYIKQQQDNGRQLAIAKDGKIEKEIVLS